MKKLLYFLFSTLLLAGCANPRAIDSSQLEGRYSVDLQSFVRSAFDDSDDTDLIGRSAISLITNALELNVNFYGNGKGVLEVDGWGIGFVEKYLNSDLDKVNEFAYRIDNDSVLMVKNQEHDFERVGVLRKLADNYDYLQLVDDDGYTINLIKTAESEK